ncbi:MAG TPA: hypothetical protein VGV92_08830 [Gammaproteobacteria bacterium]|nr:hypothetical protein [Gammaproteobacteria bacterium]
MDENDSGKINKPPTMKSPKEIEEAIAERMRSAPKKSAPLPQKKSGTATVYYSATGDVTGVTFEGKHYENTSAIPNRPDFENSPAAPRSDFSKTFQIENIDPSKLLQTLESRAQETAREAIAQQKKEPQQAATPTTPQSTAAPTPPPLANPVKRNRGLPEKLSAKPTYDPSQLPKPQQPVVPEPVVQQKVVEQPQPAEPQPATPKQPSSAAAHAEPAVPDNKCYDRLDEKCDGINKAFAATESTKDSTLVKEGDVYHVRTPSKESDVVVNPDGSMQGGSHGLNNKEDPKAIADKISAEMVIMAKTHQESGSKEPFHLNMGINEPLSDEQRIKAKQIEKLVQHNLEKEFDTGNKNGLDKSQFTFAGKPIPPLAPAPPAQNLTITPKGSATPKKNAPPPSPHH